MCSIVPSILFRFCFHLSRVLSRLLITCKHLFNILCTDLQRLMKIRFPQLAQLHEEVGRMTVTKVAVVCKLGFKLCQQNLV